jgi:hypothetical protein
MTLLMSDGMSPSTTHLKSSRASESTAQLYVSPASGSFADGRDSVLRLLVWKDYCWHLWNFIVIRWLLSAELLVIRLKGTSWRMKSVLEKLSKQQH